MYASCRYRNRKIQAIEDDIASKYVSHHVNIFYYLRGITLIYFLVQVVTFDTFICILLLYIYGCIFLCVYHQFCTLNLILFGCISISIYTRVSGYVLEVYFS